MNEFLVKIKKHVLSGTGVLVLAVLLLLFGAVRSVRLGNGFLFIPSFTPTPTETPTPTDIPVPTETPTPIPTFDETAFAAAFYAEVTQTAEVYQLMQTPTATSVIPDTELYSGLKMVNPADGKTLYYVKTDNDREQYGFWIDWTEVTNDEYRICARLELCTSPESAVCSGVSYYSEPAYHDFPVVNISRKQASAYCAWAGMELMTFRDWQTAVDVIRDETGNYDQADTMPLGNSSGHSNLLGNVWEWTADKTASGKGIIAGGSWKTSVQDIRAGKFGEIDITSSADDLGFRCVKRVSR